MNPKASIDLKGISGKVSKDDREDTLKWFENSESDEIKVLSNCQLIGEGVDTDSADMCVFLDPKGSIVAIIQNIGRICRKKTHDRKSVILLPVYVNKEQYENAETPEERDEVIRAFVNAKYNYNPILNVLSALRQEDPEYYDLCIRYPFCFSPEEVREGLKEKGFKVADEGGQSINSQKKLELIWERMRMRFLKISQKLKK